MSKATGCKRETFKLHKHPYDLYITVIKAACNKMSPPQAGRVADPHQPRSCEVASSIGVLREWTGSMAKGKL